MHLSSFICTYFHLYALASLIRTYPHLHALIFTHMHLSLLIHTYLHSYAFTVTYMHLPAFIRTSLSHSHLSSLIRTFLTSSQFHLPSLIRGYLHFYTLNDRNERQIGRIIISVSFVIGLLLYLLEPVFFENVVFLPFGVLFCVVS